MTNCSLSFTLFTLLGYLIYVMLPFVSVTFALLLFYNLFFCSFPVLVLVASVNDFILLILCFVCIYIKKTGGGGGDIEKSRVHNLARFYGGDVTGTRKRLLWCVIFSNNKYDPQQIQPQICYKWVVGEACSS